MRILHTSDWHLGRLFHGASLLQEQTRALARIVELVEELQVELVIIAGDLYDRSIPPADAVELFDRTLHQLHRAGAAVVAISGNHDSAVRVGFGDRLLERLGVTVRGDLRRTGEAVVLHPDDGPPVRVYPIPYLDPLATAHLARAEGNTPNERDALNEGYATKEGTATTECADGATAVASAPRSVAPTIGSSERTGLLDEPSGGRRARFTHHDAMAWAMSRVRADLDASADACRSVVVAHAFLTGGDPSASERELSVGHVEQVRLDLFDGIDYVALGHLHQRQSFADGRVAYSGTPLAYSFSEQHHIKSVRLIDLAADGTVEVEQLPLGVGRPLRTISGPLESLLADPSLADAESAWVRAVLTDRQLPLQAMRQLQRRFPHAVELSHEPDGAERRADERDAGAHVRAADPLDLSARFLAARRGLPTDAAERELLAGAIDAVRAGGAA